MPASSGEMLNPSSIVIPTYTGAEYTTMESGALFLSGGKLLFAIGGAFETITSS